MRQNPRKQSKRKSPNDVVRFVEHSMNIGKQVDAILKKMGKPHSFLAEQMGKNESEVSKWFRGTHNFTLKTISKIEAVLGETILITSDQIIQQLYIITPSITKDGSNKERVECSADINAKYIDAKKASTYNIKGSITIDEKNINEITECNLN